MKFDEKKYIKFLVKEWRRLSDLNDKYGESCPCLGYCNHSLPDISFGAYIGATQDTIEIQLKELLGKNWVEEAFK